VSDGPVAGVLGPFGDGTLAAAVRAHETRSALRVRGVEAVRLFDRTVADSSPWLDEPVEVWDGRLPVAPLPADPRPGEWDELAAALGSPDPGAPDRERRGVRERNAGWIAAADHVQVLIWRLDAAEAAARDARATPATPPAPLAPQGRSRWRRRR